MTHWPPTQVALREYLLEKGKHAGLSRGLPRRIPDKWVRGPRYIVILHRLARSFQSSLK